MSAMHDFSEVERAAQQWHDDHFEEADHSHSSCWCCCIACDDVNPYFDATRWRMRNE